MVDSDNRKFSDRAIVSDAKQRVGSARTYDARNRFYGILLLFIIVAGLSIVGLPSLRQRLMTRVAALHAAINGHSGPVAAEVGAEQEPFPEEFERPAYSFPGSDRLLSMDKIWTVKSGGPVSPVDASHALIAPESADEKTSSAGYDSTDDSNASDSKGGIHYTQGEVERDAYALLLESYPKVAEMVKGGGTSLQFRSWGCAKRSADVYWVRLIFQTGDGLEVEYIWQVELESKRVLPLSYNARTLS
jgi:hypothetical protein